jgi:hypothetical protein
MTLLTIAVMVGAVLLFAVAVRQRVEWPLLAYAAVIMISCLGSSSLMHAKPRLLLPAFTLLISVAVGLSKRQRSTAALTIGGAALASAWFGAYALTSWRYAI